ncbi:MAG TPA: hypothetical protein VL463_26145 [Kofleriaceae bacterium]|nr:hypothetical protein [Kofleriaceae bacterium]
MSDLLARATEAVRAAGDDVGADAATALRVRRGLESRAKKGGVLAAIAAALGIASGGGVAWAIASGRLTIGGSHAEPAVVAAPIPAPAPLPAKHAVAHAMPSAPLAPILDEVKPVEPPKPRVDRLDVLYRHAHALHFHGDDPAAALAAWDDYLRAAPSGRFAAEARYNRALDLIKLGRYADARAALAPFADGSIAPRGYRHDEAIDLIDRLSTLEAPAGTP